MDLQSIFHRLLLLLLLLLVIHECSTFSSPIRPFDTYKSHIELEKNISDLWWTVDDAEEEITFELHMATTGWISLGISKSKTFNFFGIC